MRPGRFGFALVLIAVAFAMAPAHAQSKKQQAKAAFEQAELYMEAGLYDRAAAEYETAYSLMPSLHVLLFNAGVAYEQQGDKPKALAKFQQYLRVAPNGAKAREARALSIALERKIADDAERAKLAAEQAKRDAAEQAARAVAAKADNHFAAGEAYFRARAFAEAIGEYQAAFELQPTETRYLFSIGQAHENLGQRDKAIEVYTRYLELSPSGNHAPEARARITVLRNPPPEYTPPTGATTAPPPATSLTASPPPAATDKKTGRDWGWLSVGVAVVAAGVAADVIPDSGDNGELDGTDLLPVALYGLGGVFVYMGVF